MAVVGGEALPPSLRKEINDLGVFVLQNYGTADLGLIAYESRRHGGHDRRRGRACWKSCGPAPASRWPTARWARSSSPRFNPVYPLIRFATGDLSAVLAGPSPCGRTNMRIKGWMGRADQTTKVKGMFVHPSQVAQVVARHPEILKARLEVESRDNVDEMTLRCEVRDGNEALAADDRRDGAVGLQGPRPVRACQPGELPNDGKVIADLRSYR